VGRHHSADFERRYARRDAEELDGRRPKHLGERLPSAERGDDNHRAADDVAGWHDNDIAGRHDDNVAGRHDDNVAGWHDDNVAGWHDDNVAGWHDDNVAGWHDDNVAGWHNGSADNGSADNDWANNLDDHRRPDIDERIVVDNRAANNCAAYDCAANNCAADNWAADNCASHNWPVNNDRRRDFVERVHNGSDDVARAGADSYDNVDCRSRGDDRQRSARERRVVAAHGQQRNVAGDDRVDDRACGRRARYQPEAAPTVTVFSATPS
jgi:hypothetical protein